MLFSCYRKTLWVKLPCRSERSRGIFAALHIPRSLHALRLVGMTGKTGNIIKAPPLAVLLGACRQSKIVPPPGAPQSCFGAVICGRSVIAPTGSMVSAVGNVGALSERPLNPLYTRGVAFISQFLLPWGSVPGRLRQTPAGRIRCPGPFSAYPSAYTGH